MADSGIDPCVEASWAQYDTKVKGKLRTLGWRKKGSLKLLINRKQEIQTSLDALEKSREFDAFVDQVRTTVIANGHHKGGKSFWEHAIRNALRRCGYYYGFSAGRVPSSQAVLKRVFRAFEPHEITITYLAPLEYVRLETSQINCRYFSIKQFTQSQLDEAFMTEVCELFYPWATINTGFLSSYWFLVVKEKRSLRSLGRIECDLGSVGKVTPQYSPYPALEKALQALAMYNWLPDWANNKTERRGKKREEWKGWLGFKIPFVIRITDSILDSPQRAPNLELLETEPYFDQRTNEELGEHPSCYIHLSSEQTQVLAKCLTTAEAMVGNIRVLAESSSFLSRALGFLVKGFFAKGLEQLLWHMTVLEALFGEDRPGLTPLIANRVALALGKTKDQRTTIRKQFQELYDLRSTLVHGSELKNVVWEGHLKDARELARRSLLWFLSFAGEIGKSKKRSKITMLPERKELLAVLDSRPEAIVHLARTLKSVGSSFPAIETWQEPWNHSP